MTGRRALAGLFALALLASNLYSQVPPDQQAPPDQPLLDHLAIEFMDDGWDIKQLIRTLVTSSAYRQASLPRPELDAIDPDNRLVGRQGRFRLDAEQIRDNALSVSGLLVNQIGGNIVRPYQPDGYYAPLNFPSREYVASQGMERPGAVCLSEFAGAAEELAHTLPVNPFYTQGFAEDLKRALDMPLEERRRRMTAMKRELSRNTIFDWMANFVKASGVAAEDNRAHRAGTVVTL